VLNNFKENGKDQISSDDFMVMFTYVFCSKAHYSADADADYAQKVTDKDSEFIVQR